MDLIEREAVLNVFKTLPPYEDERGTYYIHNINEAYMRIAMLPSVQGWIPCSERLPELGAYLVTEVSYGQLFVSKGYYVQENGERVWRNDTYEYDIIDPIAWMPLPPPYEEKKE